MTRRATVQDASQLLALMRTLAEFEGYADRFTVTEGELIRRGLATNEAAEFIAWVVEHNGELQGYAVVYTIPFTFDLRPTVVLKELFVADAVRSRGFGRELFAAVIAYAHSIDARLLRWQVLPSNAPAKRFYGMQGGAEEIGWEGWMLSLDAYH